jgi:hypothetical protein
MLSPRPAALDTPAAPDQVPATSSQTLYVTSKSRIFLTKAHPCARLPTADCTLVLWPLRCSGPTLAPQHVLRSASVLPSSSGVG